MYKFVHVLTELFKPNCINIVLAVAVLFKSVKQFITEMYMSIKNH